MTDLKKIADGLRRYNAWRRNNDEDLTLEMPNPKDLGIWIDSAIAVVEAHAESNVLAQQVEKLEAERDALAAELKALREQEPVAGQCRFDGESEWKSCTVVHHLHVHANPKEWPHYETRALYARPVPAHRLTDEEINDLGFQCGLQPEDAVNPSVEEFARAIEVTLFGDKSQSSEAGYSK